MPSDDLDRTLRFVLDRALGMGAVYADARFQDRRLTLVGLTARREGGTPGGGRAAWEVSRHTERGLGVRVVGPGGREGFAATSDLSRPALAKVVSDAAAGAMSGRAGPSGEGGEGTGLGPAVRTVGRAATPRRLHPDDLDLEEKRDILRTFSAEAFARSETSTVSLAYADAAGTDVFASTEGSRVETDSARVILRAGVEARHALRAFDSAESLGGVGGLELLSELAVKDLARRLAANAADWLGAPAAPGGEMTTVLDNQAGENFVHEAVGHSCEADAVLTGASVMEGRLGREVGAPGVTVVDDPGRVGTVGMYVYDDEGVPARSVTLIEEGVLRAYLHTRRTAAAMGVEPNGHARARDFGYVPIVRMGTINIEPGEFTLEEMLEDIDRGIYLMGKRGGQVDPARGVFQFRPDRARLIRRGELGEPVRAPSLSGSILDILQSIDAVGRDLVFHPGGCGKGFPGQTIPAGSGSPHLRLTRATIGGAGSGDPDWAGRKEGGA
ncbi:MAG: TldD/PmbA family protein [Bacillota bacterium]